MKSSLGFIIVLIFSLAVSGLVRGALPEGLVFLMMFDEGKGVEVSDQSGFGNDGVIEGKEDWVDGVFGKALGFDGATTNVTVPNAKPLSDIGDSLTVGLWINPTVLGGWRSILEMDGAAGWKIGLNNGTDAVVFTTYHVKDFAAVTPVVAGVWTHIAATWDGSETLVYVNGALDATIPGGGAIDVSSEPTLDIGYRSTTASSWFEGAVDDVFIYNKVLSQQEVAGLMDGISTLSVEPTGKAATTWGALKL